MIYYRIYLLKPMRIGWLI